MSEDIEAVFNNGCPTLTDNWLEELKRHTTVLLVDLPPVPSAPLFGGSYAASMAHEEYAEQKFRFDWLPGLTYRSPLLVKIPDDNERPRRYSGNSHQRRKQRRSQMATCLRLCPGCSWCGTDPGDRKDGRWTECDGSGVLPAKSTKAKRPA